MSWNETDREKYAVIRERYATDLSDEEFALVAPLLPSPSRLAQAHRSRGHPQRAVLLGPRRLSLALATEILSPLQHRPEPLLRVARQWPLGADRLAFWSCRARRRG